LLAGLVERPEQAAIAMLATALRTRIMQQVVS
jgi:hypothetical protein